ncbi:o-succinylbenzoate synthase [Psychromonas sp. RZ22]|uniref:o-succinylbenzoate synthase n=1 Tax=Psychromonas algarum TaxID=2555643 RepID=UPI00106810B1|nr:o-succinylbenzoate synthase [Psychromonas sp. RZ22]TEW53893.1 o-succinylbenzoate synthase [Psychromonas sp. RZ22]
MNKLNNHFDITNKQLSLYRFSIPFKKAINFKGQQLKTREGLWLVEQQSQGPDIIGEMSPLPGFSQETLAECEAQILTLLQQKNTLDFSDLLASVSFALFCLQQQIPWNNESINTTKLNNIPLLQGNLSEIIKRYQLLNSPKQVKLKVARVSAIEDIAIIQSLITINPDIRFRLDANQQWSLKQYTSFLTAIDGQYLNNIDYIEEPTASLTDNIALSEKFNVKIGLDESLLCNPILPTSPCIKAFIIKPTLIGDMARIKTLLKHAQQQQLEVSVSASFESPIALKQLHYLALQWQQEFQLPIHLGLDTLAAFDDPIATKNTHDTNLITHLLTQATCLWHS